ncbi:hypothetical protein [Halobacterium wangiae]|uniref:hypothetical protein n=1 Tax=Halobacterium wangiae TaxID=2902623 RepID=UPI001E2B666F|nr:hypothetical protein [Halobacterium wangiae]
MVQQVASELGHRLRPSTFGTELYRRNRVLASVTAGFLVLLAAFLVGFAIDPRTVGGESVWLKPTKFAASIALFAGSLAWLTPQFPVSDRLLGVVSAGVATGSIVEIALIGGQAARGVESHFNTATALDTAVYNVMGATIVGVVVLVAWLLVRSWRADFDVAPPFAWGIRLGVLLFVLGSFQGGTMAALSGSVTGSGGTVPVLGWNLGGDLRIAHFVGLHALETVPLAGYLAARAHQRGRVERPLRVVAAVAAAFAVALVLALAHGLAPVFR